MEFTISSLHINTHRKKKAWSWPQSQTNEAVACMTGTECQCQRALCSLGLVFHSLCMRIVAVMQNENLRLLALIKTSKLDKKHER